MKIITTTHLSDDAKWLYDKATTDTRNRLQENYNLKRLGLDGMLLCSVAYDKEPIGVCLATEKDIFNGMVRVASRFYWNTQDDEEFDIPRQATIDMIDEQMLYLSDRNVFISRDDEKPLVFKRVYRGLSSRSTFNGWKFDQRNKYYTCNGPAQWIIWNGDLCLERQET